MYFSNRILSHRWCVIKVRYYNIPNIWVVVEYKSDSWKIKNDIFCRRKFKKENIMFDYDIWPKICHLFFSGCVRERTGNQDKTEKWQGKHYLVRCQNAEMVLWMGPQAMDRTLSFIYWYFLPWRMILFQIF